MIETKQLIWLVAVVAAVAMFVGFLNATYFGPTLQSNNQIDDSTNLFYDFQDHRVFPVYIPSDPWSWGASKDAETELASIDAVYKTTSNGGSYLNNYHVAGQLFEFQLGDNTNIISVQYSGKAAVSGTPTRTFCLWNNITQNYDILQDLTATDANYTFTLTDTQIKNAITDSDNTIYFAINATNNFNQGGIVIYSDYINVRTELISWTETWVNIMSVVMIGLIIISSILYKVGVI